MQSNVKYFVALHLIIVLFGFTGIVGGLVSLDSFSIVWYRVLIAAVSLAILFPIIKQSFRLPSPRHYWVLIGTGCFVAAHWVTFYESIQLSTASLGTLCLSTTTLHVAWLEPLIMKRAFSKVELVMSVIVVYGIYFVSEDFNAQEYKALAYGLASALFAALFAVINGKVVHEVPAARIAFYEMTSALVVLTFALGFQNRLGPDLFVISMEDFGWMLFLGLICTSFAFLVYVEIVKYIGAFAASLSINLEPVYTILLAIPILKENQELNANFYIGSALIVVAILLNAIIKRYLRRKSQSNSTTVID